MVGGLRASLLLGVSAAALLAGCDWFDGNTPVSSRQARPGVERAVAVSASLPPASPTQQYQSGIVAVDEARGAIGSVVAGTGGQKAQQETVAKAALESDRRARAETERRLAERKKADAEAAAAKPFLARIVSPPPPNLTTIASPPPAPVTPHLYLRRRKRPPPRPHRRLPDFDSSRAGAGFAGCRPWYR